MKLFLISCLMFALAGCNIFCPGEPEPEPQTTITQVLDGGLRECSDADGVFVQDVVIFYENIDFLPDGASFNMRTGGIRFQRPAEVLRSSPHQFEPRYKLGQRKVGVIAWFGYKGDTLSNVFEKDSLFTAPENCPAIIKP